MGWALLVVVSSHFGYTLSLLRMRRSPAEAHGPHPADDSNRTTEDAVVDEYANIRLAPEQADRVRDFVLEEIAKLRDCTKSERERLEWRTRALCDEQQPLLDAHYADAIPLELLTTERSMITTEAITAATPLTDVDCNIAIAQSNLARTLVVAQDCDAPYQEASDNVRRQFNHVIFNRLLIDDRHQVIGELAEPFATLLGDEVRLAASQKAEAELRDLVGGVFDGADQNGMPRTKLALAGRWALPQGRSLSSRCRLESRSPEQLALDMGGVVHCDEHRCLRTSQRTPSRSRNEKSEGVRIISSNLHVVITRCDNAATNGASAHLHARWRFNGSCWASDASPYTRASSSVSIRP